MDTFTQPKITGYRQLNEEEAALMNLFKEKAEEIGLMVERLMAREDVDKRWVAIGKTHLQQGFMAVIRGIAKPTTF